MRVIGGRSLWLTGEGVYRDGSLQRVHFRPDPEPRPGVGGSGRFVPQYFLSRASFCALFQHLQFTRGRGVSGKKLKRLCLLCLSASPFDRAQLPRGLGPAFSSKQLGARSARGRRAPCCCAFSTPRVLKNFASVRLLRRCANFVQDRPVCIDQNRRCRGRL
jgi:hypothetical protein